MMDWAWRSWAPPVPPAGWPLTSPAPMPYLSFLASIAPFTTYWISTIYHQVYSTAYVSASDRRLPYDQDISHSYQRNGDSVMDIPQSISKWKPDHWSKLQ